MELIPSLDVEVEMLFEKPVKIMIHHFYLLATNIYDF
jgi:hypothetical protein